MGRLLIELDAPLNIDYEFTWTDEVKAALILKNFGLSMTPSDAEGEPVDTSGWTNQEHLDHAGDRIVIEVKSRANRYKRQQAEAQARADSTPDDFE